MNDLTLITAHIDGATLAFSGVCVFLTMDQLECLAMIGRNDLQSACGLTPGNVPVAFQSRPKHVVITMGQNGNLGTFYIPSDKARALPAAVKSSEDVFPREGAV